MMWLKLTSAKGTPVYVNFDHVLKFRDRNDDGGAKLDFVSTETASMDVRESADQIEAMLHA